MNLTQQLLHTILTIAFPAILVIGSSSAQAVVNGTLEKAEAHPEVALLVLAKEKLSADKLFLKNLNDYGVCTGGFVSDRLVISAGHCLESDGEQLFPYLATPKDGGFTLTAPVATATEYIYENLEGVPGTGNNVCAPGPKPLAHTKTPDVSLILFPAKTTNNWFTVDSSYVPKTKDRLKYFGYGTDQNPFAGFTMSKNPLLRSGSSEVWRITTQRMGFVSDVMASFAADGDSGGPVTVNGKLVGVMSTISERCETQFGEDYAILNTATLLSDTQTRAFVKKALSHFENQ